MKLNIFFIGFVLFFLNSLSAQKIDQAFFDKADSFFKKEVKDGLLPYEKLDQNTQLAELISVIEKADLSNASEELKKAFYINAYNLHVINAATEAYPISSVQSISGFFDGKKVLVANEKLTLNSLEKDYLLKPYKDARLHFVLVCGALGCPPITSFAYRPDLLEEQLEQQTKLAINNPSFIKPNGDEIQLSQIFKWYASDFGGNKSAVIDFINQYHSNPFPKTVDVTYYAYDWSLNNVKLNSIILNETSKSIPSNNASRYIVSSTIPKGSSEVKIFNNLYSQKTGSVDNLTDRSTFFTTTVSYLFGLTNRLNIGLNTRYRRVRNDKLPSSIFAVLGASEAESKRQGLTALGPQFRYAPIKQWSNFSIQSSFVFPIGKELGGSDTQPYIDWNGATWNTQFFNDFSLGNSFSLFTEFDVLLEDLGGINRISTPVTVIFSFNPNPKTTIYTIGGFSPYWQKEFDYFLQGGLGAKYQITTNFELELLVTDFSNKFLLDSGGQAATYNFGIRFNIPNRN